MYRTVRAGTTSPPSSDSHSSKGSALIFYVVDERPDPELYLAYYLRYRLNLRGTKLACNEGQCGSCVVMLSKHDLMTNAVKHLSVNACLVPIVAVHGCAVTTIEGIGSLSRGLHPVQYADPDPYGFWAGLVRFRTSFPITDTARAFQERLSKGHGSQCGFCTPGFIMAMYSLLRNKTNPSKHDIELYLQGNLCRCTGYRPILESFYGFSQENRRCGSSACCKSGNSNGTDECCRREDSPAVSDWSHCRMYDPTQEPIFPPELSKEHSFAKKSLVFIGPRVTWFRPSTLSELLGILEKHPDVVVSGTYGWTSLTTRVSPEAAHTYVITTMDIAEFRQVRQDPDGLFIGAGLTIDEMHSALQCAISETAGESKFFGGLSKILPFLGSQHLRNFVSWTGNVASGWATSDIAICLLSISATLHIAGPKGQRSLKLKSNESYYRGDGKVNLGIGELVTGVTIPFSTEHDKFFVFKQGQRHGPDGPIVNAAMRVTFEPSSHIVREAAFAFGGLTDRPILAELTAKEVAGKEWNEALLEHGTTQLNREVTRTINNQGIRKGYRVVLCLSFFRKFYELVKQELNGQLHEPAEIQSLDAYPHSEPMKATQIYNDTTQGQSPIDPIGRPILHQSGEKHATGEATYIDDIPSILGECHVAVIYSERAHARIVKIDTAEALKIPGVLTYIDGKDIPPNGSMRPALPFFDEPMFAEGEVFAIGQIIGAVVAEDLLIAQRAAGLVKVHYEDLPAILTCEEAISANSMFPQELHHNRGQSPTSIFPECHLVLQGDVHLGFQEHFYMEPNNCLVIPKDGDEYEVYSSSQALSFAQHEVAAALGIAAHKVTAKLKRIGGGFGGKQTNHSKPLHSAALAARKLKRPARCVLSRQDDFAATGKRHGVLWKYEVGVDQDGRIKALHILVYANAGWSLDLSEIFLHHHLHSFIDVCYNIPHLQADGYLCKTNLPSSTAMRGFGKVEAHFLFEEIVERVARRLRMAPDKVREINFYKKGDILLNGQVLRDYELLRCWQECKFRSEYEKKRREVDDYNSRHQWKKRGLAITPVFWAQGEQGSIIEQGGILVSVYRDGSVQVAHGGTEMGQGLNTKVMMAAANAFNIPYEKITIIENGTDKVPNAVFTGASVGTDVFCRAVQTACKQIQERLEPYMAANPKGTWEQWIMAAFVDRCHLAAHAHCKLDYPDVQSDSPGYYVSGAAAAAVEVDCLTGDHRILSCHLVMDVGDTINPAIDIGQIEGAFMQGVGMTTMEELLYDKNGKLLTPSALTYKIPSVATVPRDFHVVLLKNEHFKGNIYNSKAVGEPPFSLGYCVHYAIKDAILAFRAASGEKGIYVDVGSPLTPEKTRLQMRDHLAKMVDYSTDDTVIT